MSGVREPGFAGRFQLSPLRRDDTGGCRVWVVSRDRGNALAIPQTASASLRARRSGIRPTAQFETRA